MARLGRITVLATAAEAARQWAKNNPDKAGAYIDKAGAAVDQVTKGKYSRQITSATGKAKGAVGGGHRGGTTTAPPAPGTTPPPSSQTPPPPVS